MKVHIFEFHGGKITVDGKSQWPDAFNISIPKFLAWDMIHSILHQLQRDEETIIYSTCGKLEYDIDEDI